MSLSVEYISDGKWRLNTDLHYVHPKYGMITVASGTTTDLDSVPRLPVIYWLAKNRTVIGATIHDSLYRAAKITRKPPAKDTPITRRIADRIFVDAMKEEGVSWWARRLVWLGVRFGGFLAWRKHREAEPTS